MKTLNRLLISHLDMCDQFRGLADQVTSLGTELDGAHKTVAQLQEKCAGLEEKLRERTAAPAQADALAAIKILQDQGYAWTGVGWVMQQPVPAPAMPVPAPAMPVPAPAMPVPAPAMPVPAPAMPVPCLPDVAAEPGEPAIPPKPEGDDWRLFNTRQPRHKSAIVQALLFDGSTREAPAHELEWSLRSGGVAWWRPAPTAVTCLPDAPVVRHSVREKESGEVHSVPLDWPVRATHYLYNPKAMAGRYYFAELHEGVYYHLPAAQSESRDWEWARRGSFTVRAGAWKIVAERP